MLTPTLYHFQNFECVEVELESKDTMGPGFSVTGTMTEGIIISSLHDKGPARESGRIASGELKIKLIPLFITLF